MAVKTRQQQVASSSSANDNVFLYYPNIIGYLRVILMMVAFYTAQTSYTTTFLCYFLSFFGDAVDGYVARRFNQCSTFGAIFDMITDRVATCGLLVVLSNCYPTYSIAFISLISLDIYSHWLHVESVHVGKLISTNHKSKEALEKKNWLVRKYYEIYPLFAYCCVGAEIFYLLLYLLHFLPDSRFLFWACWVGVFPGCVIKQIINVAQLMAAAQELADFRPVPTTSSSSSSSSGKKRA